MSNITGYRVRGALTGIEPHHEVTELAGRDARDFDSIGVGIVVGLATVDNAKEIRVQGKKVAMEGEVSAGGQSLPILPDRRSNLFPVPTSTVMVGLKVIRLHVVSWLHIIRLCEDVAMPCADPQATLLQLALLFNLLNAKIFNLPSNVFIEHATVLNVLGCHHCYLKVLILLF